jgi:hypothetical protein
VIGPPLVTHNSPCPLASPKSGANAQEHCNSDQGKRRMYFLLPRFNIAHQVLLESCVSDPLVHYGRHFGRTVHALCNVHSLILNGILYMGELAERPEDTFTHEYAVCLIPSFHYRQIFSRERREHRIFQLLLQSVPGLEARLLEGSDEEVVHVAELVRYCHSL